CASSSCKAALPIRMGGLDQMGSNEASAGTSGGVNAATGAIVARRATRSTLRRSKSRARSLTSIAVTWAAGCRRAAVRAIGPQAQNLARWRLCDGRERYRRAQVDMSERKHPGCGLQVKILTRKGDGDDSAVIGGRRLRRKVVVLAHGN